MTDEQIFKMHYDTLVARIKEGKFPNLVGVSLSNSQIAELREILAKKQREITEYCEQLSLRQLNA